MNSSQLGDGFLEGGSGGCDFLRGGCQSQGKAHGLVSGIVGFHGGDDVGGIGGIGEAGRAAAGADFRLVEQEQ